MLAQAQKGTGELQNEAAQLHSAALKLQNEVATSFPGSSLFLPRESTLVAAGHVSARF